MNRDAQMNGMPFLFTSRYDDKSDLYIAFGYFIDDLVSYRSFLEERDRFYDAAETTQTAPASASWQ